MKIRIASNSIKNNELWSNDADLSVGKITYLKIYLRLLLNRHLMRFSRRFQV